MECGAVSTRRGRPTRSLEDIRLMREKVAQAAALLFRDEGYASVSMRRLAREVGCTPMTLYAYFDSKADILSHLWEGVYGDLFADLTRLAREIEDPALRLGAVANHYVDFWVRHPELYRLVFMTEGVSQSEVSAFLTSSGAVERHQLFNGLVSEVLGHPSEPVLKRRTEALLCGLAGIAHCHVTISGYPWSAPDILVAEILASLVGEPDR